MGAARGMLDQLFLGLILAGELNCGKSFVQAHDECM